MSEPRLKSALWVSAALRRGDALGRYGTVLRRGDADAGAVLVVLRGRAGASVLTEVRDGEGALAWMRGTGPEPVTEAEAEAYVARRLRLDADLWVLEFESPDLLPPFEARVL
jgi:hypothetical protein